jgi:hypothetical protein
MNSNRDRQATQSASPNVRWKGLGTKYRGPAWLLGAMVCGGVLLVALVLAIVLVVTGWLTPAEAAQP